MTEPGNMVPRQSLPLGEGEGGVQEAWGVQSGGEGSRVLVTARPLSLFGPLLILPVEEAEYLGGWQGVDVGAVAQEGNSSCNDQGGKLAAWTKAVALPRRRLEIR